MNTVREYKNEFKLKYNHTTLYMLPSIGLSVMSMPKSFVSAYIIDEEKPKIALVFEGDMVILKTNADFIEKQIINDSEYAYIYSVPEAFEVDYNLFKIGRYTKFSIKYKDLLLKHYGKISGAGEKITMIDSLYPDNISKSFRAKSLGVSISDLPNGEVASLPSLDKELYYNVIKKIQEKSGSVL